VPEGVGTLLKLTEGASLRGTVFNLVNSMVGAGILALPYACSQTGWGLGIVLVVVLAVLGDLTIWMLIYCLDATRERSLAGMAEILHGRGFGLFVDVTVWCNNVGTMISYAIIIGDLLPSFLATTFGIFAMWDGQARKTAVLAGTGLPLLVLSSLKNLDALRHVSLLCLVMILVFVASLFFMGIGVVPTVLPDDMPAAVFTGDSASIMRQIPVLSFAFTCQANVPIFYAELRRQKSSEFSSKFPTKRSKIMMAAHLSFGLVGMLYTVAMVCGYLAFRGRTHQDVLTNFDPEIFPPAEFVRGCYVMVIACSFPVIAFSAVVSFHRLLWQLRQQLTGDGTPAAVLSPRVTQPSPQSRAWPLLPGRSEVFSEENLLPTEEHLQEPCVYQPAPTRKSVPAPSDALRIAEASVLVAFSVATAILIPDLSLVFGLIGGLTSSSLMFIFPCLAYLKVKRDMSTSAMAGDGPPAWVARIIVVFGFAVAVGSTSLVVMSTINSAQ
jgi:amino acid permease